MDALRLAAALLLAVPAACGSEDGAGETDRAGTAFPPPAETGAPWFVEAAQESGLVFDHRSGAEGSYRFPEIMCGGAALFDMDSDGDLDAYLVQAGSLLADPDERPGNQIFENQGGGRFRDRSPGSGAEDRGYGMGVATGDADGDGQSDLFVTNVGRDALLLNQGGGTFRDATADAGLQGEGWGTSAAFLDHDRDGDLDLFVVNYIFWSLDDDIVCQGPPHGRDYCSPKTYGAPAPDQLYENRGGGTFRDASLPAGLRATFGNGLGVLSSDFDGDGFPDVFVANDGTLNQLWMNDRDGTFREEAMQRGVAVDNDGRAKAGMGVSAADLDDDGDEDLLVVNLDGESDSYYRNEGDHFRDRTPLAGLALASRRFTRFGVGFLDFDNDGLLDLYEANGRVIKPPGAYRGDPFAEPNLLMRGLSGARFEEVLPSGGTAAQLVATSRAAAFGDVDGDGGVDVLVVNRDARAHLLLNRVAGRAGWIGLDLREGSGAPALGAIVRLRIGERLLLRTVRTAYSYCAASSPVVHLGLGRSQAVEAVEVTWADGTSESFGVLPAGSVHELHRGRGTPPGPGGSGVGEGGGPEGTDGGSGTPGG